MKKGLIILIALIILVALAIFIVLFYPSSDVGLNPEDKAVEECKTLEYNGEGKTNIVFFSDKKDAERYVAVFYEFEPFKSNKKEFNFYYIDSYEPECEIYKGVALLCYSRVLIRKAGSCPNDYIVVVKEENNKIRSSNYMNVMSLNSKHPASVFIHEFGHGFANFAEEYIPGKIPRNSKNCVSDCDKFDVKDGCYEGCSKDSYYRSVDRGIMRTLSSKTFGVFDTKIILEKMNKEHGTSLSAFAVKEDRDCSGEKYYLIEGSLVSQGSEIVVASRSVESGCIGDNGAGAFRYNLILEDDSVVKTGDFNPELIFTDAPGEEIIEGETFDSDKNFLLKVPIVDKSKSIEIVKDNNIISEINLEGIGSYPCRK